VLDTDAELLEIVHHRRDRQEIVFPSVAGHLVSVTRTEFVDPPAMRSFHATSHFDAMTLYYAHMGWGTYTSDFEDIDRQT
jgi:hypothetical protein